MLCRIILLNGVWPAMPERLACQPWSFRMLPDIVQPLAVDISLAALLGENIYNFGELLLHPIVSPLCEQHV